MPSAPTATCWWMPPQVWMPSALAKLGLEATVIALLGSLMPTYALLRLDPARAFQV